MDSINPIWKEALLKRTIETWGERAQLEMAQEEATEMALAVRKHIRKNNRQTVLDLAGEIADVEIMIEQLKILLKSEDFKTLVNEVKMTKLLRLESRLNEHKFEDEQTSLPTLNN